MKTVIPAIMACLLGVTIGVIGGRMFRQARPAASESTPSSDIAYSPSQIKRMAALAEAPDHQ